MGILLRPRNIATSSGLDAFLRMGMNQSWAGISITPANALQVAAVFACVRVIAEDIGKLPFMIYQQSTEHERQKLTTSPFWRLLHDKPNSYQTSQQFREYLTACALLRGNGYALKNVVNGQVRELLPLHPGRVRVEQLADFELIYHVTMPTGSEIYSDGRQAMMTSGKEETMTRREIFHLPGLTIDGPIGVSVVSYARQTLGIALGASRHAGTFFGNGMKPSGIFKHPRILSQAGYERLKGELKEKHGGENSNETLILEEGMDYSPISLTNKDSQFLESRTFEVLEVCRWFRLKPHKIAELSRATFSNIEQESIEHVTDALMPWGMRWEYAVNQQVIVTNNIYAELNFDALLRGTTLERYKAYQMAAGGPAPWMRRNEIRRRENLEPVDGLDEILQPMNMKSAGDGGANDTSAA